MIVVTIEKWPHGRMSERYEIGRVEITNDMTGDIEVSSYDVELKQPHGSARHHSVVKRGRVDAFPRGKYNPDSNPYALLLYALRACLTPARKGD
jgi:hypothetical protein